jgi:hypothetical protein
VIPTAAAFHGISLRRLAELRYDGRHRLGDELAQALLDAAARSVGRHHGEAYRIQVRYTCEDLDLLRRRLRALERDIERLLGDHEVGTLLTTIEGIGPQTSARLVATRQAVDARARDVSEDVKLESIGRIKGLVDGSSVLRPFTPRPPRGRRVVTEPFRAHPVERILCPSDA